MYGWKMSMIQFNDYRRLYVMTLRQDPLTQQDILKIQHRLMLHQRCFNDLGHVSTGNTYIEIVEGPQKLQLHRRFNNINLIGINFQFIK